MLLFRRDGHADLPRRARAPAADAIRIFALEHRGCGELRGDAKPITPEGYAVWVACNCGARLDQWVSPADAEADLLRAVLLGVRELRAMRRFDVVTFDCYGTLIDWEPGMVEAFQRAAASDGVSLDGSAVLRTIFDTRPAAEAPEYRTYRDRLTDAAVRVGGQLGWPITRERASFLPESLPGWTPFPDTNPALERLSRAGYTLGILSNVDDDLLDGTRQHFTVPFEVIVTAEQVRSYKPAPGHFTTARDRIGGGRWLHAAQSYFHDVVPAVAFDIPVAWINRKSERPTGAARPNHQFRTLAELADWLT